MKNQQNKWYVLAILTIVYVFNFIDRQIINIIAEDVKQDLGLSDTQLGMMTGLAFAIFYSVMAIPISRFADKGVRKNVLAVCLGIWSIMTAISGMVTNFTQMFLARMGVGLGEAGGVPTSYSLISDVFPANQRGKAMSIYMIGTSIGVFIAFVGGGYMLVNYGWRMSLYVVGLPGILLAVLVWLTIKEPEKGAKDNVKELDKTTPSMKEIFQIAIRKKTFVYITLAKTFLVGTSYSINAFVAAFFIRLHNMPKGDLFFNLGITVLIGGVIGGLLGGYFSDKLGEKDIRWYAWIGVVGNLLCIIPHYLYFTSQNVTIAIVMFGVMAVTTLLSGGPAVAVMQSVVNAKMRAGVAAIYLLISNLIGLGLGPLSVGMISDWLEPTYGVESIRYALMFTFIPIALSTLFYYLAGKHYKKDVYVNFGEYFSNCLAS